MIPYLFDTGAEEMKTCFKCHEHRPLSEFYSHPRCRQGTLNKCKKCTKADARAQHVRNMANALWVAKERERQRIKERARREAGLAKASPEAGRAWSKRNRHKKKANSRVRWNLTRGLLQRQPCEVCGSTNVQAHHDDYARPLDVRWLCVKHHNEHHVKMRLLELGVAA